MRPSVDCHPLLLRGYEDATPETPIPASQEQVRQQPSGRAQGQLISGPAMVKKEDRAVARSREKRKRVSHKRNRAPKVVRYDGRGRRGFGGMPWFSGMN